MDRNEHLAWAKERALVYADAGDVENAFASLASDLRKHPELADHSGLTVGALLLVGGHLNDPARMREHIKGYH